MTSQSLNKTAVRATLHCLAGCSIGEVIGLVIGQALGWGTLAIVVLSIFLAFVSGYALTMTSLLRSGMTLRTALAVALAADTLSITVMEITDNAVVALVPGAMAAGLDDAWFWVVLAASLAVAFVVALPVNRWLLGRGRGHALVHELHEHSN